MYKYNPIEDTFDLVSDLSGYVPYTNAIADIVIPQAYKTITTTNRIKYQDSTTVYNDLTTDSTGNLIITSTYTLGKIGFNWNGSTRAWIGAYSTTQAGLWLTSSTAVNQAVLYKFTSGLQIGGSSTAYGIVSLYGSGGAYIQYGSYRIAHYFNTQISETGFIYTDYYLQFDSSFNWATSNVAFIDFTGQASADSSTHISNEAINSSIPKGPDPTVWDHVYMLKCTKDGTEDIYIPVYKKTIPSP